jgi:outer membrane cobalamin receptor
VFSVFILVSQENVLLGKVLDSKTQEVLIGATIVYGKTGAYTNSSGIFRINEKKKTDSLEIHMVGYLSKKISTDFLKKEKLGIVYLREDIYSSEIVEVRTEVSQLPLIKIQPGVSVIPVMQLKEFPTLGGESDILRMAQLKNSVMIGKDFSNSLYIRGGRHDHNLILLDGMELFSPSHLGGFLSIFNTEAVNFMELYKSSVPVNYTGKLASVLNVSMKDGNHNKIRYGGGISLLSSQFYVEGPINEQTTFYVTLRKAYYDYLVWLYSKSIDASEETKQVVKNSDLGFFDALLKVKYEINKNHSLIFNQVYANDAFDVKSLDYINKSIFYSDWDNLGSQIRLNSIWSNRLLSEIKINYTDYRSNFKDQENYPYIYRSSEIKKIIFSSKMNYLFSESTQFLFGAKVENNSFRNELIKHEELSFYKSPNQIYSSAYGNLQTSFLDVFDFNLGLRYNIYGNFNKKLEPRLSILYKLSNIENIKASYDIIHQSNHSLSSSQLEDPSQFYFPANELLPLERSETYSFSYEREFTDFYIQLESYYRDFENIPFLKQKLNSFKDISSDKILVSGNAKSYGFDFHLEKTRGKWTGWINYGFNNTFYKFKNFNENRKFSPKFHKPHQLNIVVNYNWKKNWKLGFVTQAGSGFLLTVPTKRYSDAGNYIYVYEEINNKRTPFNYRTDINFRYLFKIYGADAETNISVYNLFFSPNPLFVYYDYEAPMYQTLGMIPTIGLKFHF